MLQTIHHGLLTQVSSAFGLQAAKDALEDHSNSLLRRFEQLEAQAAGLQDSNELLAQQVHLKHASIFFLTDGRASIRRCSNPRSVDSQ